MDRNHSGISPDRCSRVRSFFAYLVPKRAETLRHQTAQREREIQCFTIRLEKRELFVLYPDGVATTRLRIPSEKQDTARNMTTGQAGRNDEGPCLGG